MASTANPRVIVEMAEDEAWERLEEAPILRLAYVSAGRPHVVPVNHTVLEGRVYVRTMPGTKLTATLKDLGAPVALEVDGTDPESRLGWSVVAEGAMYPVLEQTDVAGLDRRARASWALGDSRGQWLRIEVDRLTGRRLVEK